MPLLLTLLLSCGPRFDAAACDETRGAAEEEWEKVAGFYERTADLMLEEREGAAANVAATTSMRRGASASSAAARRRSQTGFTDLRSGQVYKDPEVAKRQRAQARAAGARAARHEEQALLYLIDLVEVADRVEARRAKALAARAFGAQDPLAPVERWRDVPMLDETELSSRAWVATRAAQQACLGRPD